MSSPEKSSPQYESVDIEDWGPKEFQECRSVAIERRPEKPRDLSNWLRAKMHLVWAYREGYGTEPDSRRHFEILAQVAELDEGAELGAKWLLARAHKEGIGTPPDESAYFRWMQRAAEDEDPEAMFSLAEAYQSGSSVERNEDLYFHWTRKMARQKSPFALMELAQAYRTGKGTIKSDAKFFKYATDAMHEAKNAMAVAETDEDSASEDLPRAIQLVAQAHRDGIGTVEDERKYFELLSEATDAVWSAIDRQQDKEPEKIDDLKSSLSQIIFEFAMAHLDGRGTSKSAPRARKYMEHAAKAGDVKAMLKLSEFYTTGVGASKSLMKAFSWQSRAAEKNDADAMYRTAIAYGTAAGTHEDAAQFQSWAQKAVRAGHEKAFMAQELADLHTKGLITPRKTSNVLRLFDKLQSAVKEIKSEHALSIHEASNGIAHFTTLETLHSMLPSPGGDNHASHLDRSNHLRLYNLTYVNDPQEGKILLLGENPETTHIQNFFPELMTKTHDKQEFLFQDTVPLSPLAFSVYVGSFTLRSDRLDLWRAYGHDGSGFCIVLPFESFVHEREIQTQAFAGLAASETHNSDVSMTLYRVVYDKDRIRSTLSCLNRHLFEIQKARERLAKAVSDPEFVRSQINLTVRAILSDVLYLYKHEEYSNEEEVRMLAPFAISATAVHADKQSPARLYVKTKPFLFAPGSKIIIGPKVLNPEAVRLELKHRLDRNGHPDVQVALSHIQYR